MLHIGLLAVVFGCVVVSVLNIALHSRAIFFIVGNCANVGFGGV